MKKNLKLFVWEDVLSDYTSGMVCILAESLEQAFDLLYERDSFAWSELQGIWDSMDWEHKEIKKLEADKSKDSLTALQKRYLNNLGLKVAKTHIKPEVITIPTAFVVHGGG